LQYGLSATADLLVSVELSQK